MEKAWETIILDLPAYQRAAVLGNARFAWYCWARQTGKSFALSLRRVVNGLSRRRNQIILSAGHRQSREVMDKVRAHCAALGLASSEDDRTYFDSLSPGRYEIRLPTGARVIALPANPMTARGYTGDVFLDEFAMHKDDEEIWSALFPTLLRGDGELDVASTPRGCKNMFHRLMGNTAFSHSTITLEAAIADGLEADLSALREGIGGDLAWRQEFCCEFLDETSSFMTHDLIRRCQDPRLSPDIDWPSLDRRNAEIYAGVDVGRHRDVTAVWLWQKQGDLFITRGVAILSAAPFAEQEDLLDRLLSRRALRRLCIDATGLGMQFAERLVQRYGEHRVEPVNFSAARKTELAGLLRASAERDLLRIPVDPAIANDWHATQRIVTPAGLVRYDADRASGGHADRFWAAALGLHAAHDAVGPVEFLGGGALAFARKGTW